MKTYVSSGIEYQILEFLGEGGSSEVYRAKRHLSDVKVDQELALKILKSQTSVDLWRNEFKNFQGLQSPHLLNIFGFDRVDGRNALLMECIKGFSLSELKRHSNLELNVKLEILWQVFQGLQDLHRLNKCHGDLSPNNILIEYTGRVVLTDFLGQQAGFGTLSFTAESVLNGASPNQETDLYSLEKIASWLGLEDWKKYSYSDSKKDLARIITHLLKAKEQQTQFTKAIEISSVNRTNFGVWFVRALCCLFLLPLLIGSNASSVLSNDYTIEIITEKWAEIAIDDIKIGYSPLRYISKNPEIKIHWRNQDSSGELKLVLRPGEHRRLHDGDLFSLPAYAETVKSSEGENHDRYK